MWSAFQFTLPRGERLTLLRRASPCLRFQFTLPRGERQTFRWVVSRSTSFQFTLPRGERPASGTQRSSWE